MRLIVVWRRNILHSGIHSASVLVKCLCGDFGAVRLTLYHCGSANGVSEPKGSFFCCGLTALEAVLAIGALQDRKEESASARHGEV